ncbi:MAG: hypothetical protein IIA72_14415 [Proteobacteria bacterium]|nr:hypothetical protein [Pseudomonadota bacterium]
MKLPIATIKELLLAAFYKRVMIDDRKPTVALSKFSQVFGLEFSMNVMGTLADDHVKSGYLNKSKSASGSIRFTISGKGLEYVEEQLQDPDSFSSVFMNSEFDPFAVNQVAAVGNHSPQWSQPDSSKKLSVSAVEQIKEYITECIILISRSELSQADKSQISGLLKICDNFLDLPTPKLGLLKRILISLRSIKELTDLIDKILGYLE